MHVCCFCYMYSRFEKLCRACVLCMYVSTLNKTLFIYYLFIYCQSVTFPVYVHAVFHFVSPLEKHNLYFGKHNNGDKSYKVMLQALRMKISYRKLEVANFHGWAKNFTTPETCFIVYKTNTETDMKVANH